MFFSRLVTRLESRLLEDIGPVFVHPRTGLLGRIAFLVDCAFRRPNSGRSLTVNLLLTSEAEARLFEPLIYALLEREQVKCHVFSLGSFKLPDGLKRLIKNSSNVSVPSSLYPIVQSCTARKNYLNLICLDHQFYTKAHEIGIRAVQILRRMGAKTVCLQHGGAKKDSVVGQLTSASEFQIVWGELMRSQVISQGGWPPSKVFVSGNPLHDRLLVQDCVSLKKQFELYARLKGREIGPRKIILLATCLHTEYDAFPDCQVIYRDYVNQVYEAVDHSNQFLVIKMHPVDSVHPNNYEIFLGDERVRDVLIIEPKDRSFDFYKLLNICDLLVTRASTAAEEALLLQKPVLAFDILEEGPAKNLSPVSHSSIFRECVGRSLDLAKAIKSSLDCKPVQPHEHHFFVEGVTYRLDGLSSERLISCLHRIGATE